MSHRFRFTKEPADRVKSFNAGEKQEKPAAPAEQPPTAQTEIIRQGGVVIAARTDIGKMRKSNQDALILAMPLVGVADGMGGHNGGETASAGARDGLCELLKDQKPSPDGLRAAVEEVNRRLFAQQEAEESLQGMGTTLTALWLDDTTVHIGHVGDSRAYRLRDGEWQQMTDDHSVVAELMRGGMITAEQAANHPMRNVITRAVGTEAGIEVDILSFERARGDVWLVCSDGLHGLVADADMQKMLAENAPEKAAELLMNAALDAGGRDNVSLVILLDGEEAT